MEAEIVPGLEDDAVTGLEVAAVPDLEDVAVYGSCDFDLHCCLADPHL